VRYDDQKLGCIFVIEKSRAQIPTQTTIMDGSLNLLKVRFRARSANLKLKESKCQVALILMLVTHVTTMPQSMKYRDNCV